MNDIEIMNGGGSVAPVEEAPYYESRVRQFMDLYESCSPSQATEFFDDVKLRDFFGCEHSDYQTEGLKAYREELLNHYMEWSCPWLNGKQCFPVRERIYD